MPDPAPGEPYAVSNIYDVNRSPKIKMTDPSSGESTPVKSVCLQRGGQGWLLQDFVFVKNSESKHGVIYLRCLNWKNCHARAKILPDSRFIVTDPNHSHPKHDLDAISQRKRTFRSGPYHNPRPRMPFPYPGLFPFQSFPFAARGSAVDGPPAPLYMNDMHARSYDAISFNGRLSINLDEPDEDAQSDGGSIIKQEGEAETPSMVFHRNVNGHLNGAGTSNGGIETVQKPDSAEPQEIESDSPGVSTVEGTEPGQGQLLSMTFVDALTKAFTEGQRVAERQFLDYDARRRAEESEKEQRWLQLVLEHQRKREEVLIKLVASLAKGSGHEGPVAETLRQLDQGPVAPENPPAK